MRERRLGIAEDGKAERRYGIRKIKELTESLFPFGDGVDAAPERSQFLGACREQQVFHSGGAVLHPVFAVIGRRGVPANEDGERSLLDHTRIWMEIRYLIQFLAVRDDHEPPRLDAPCGRRGHGGAQQFFDEIFSDGPVQELADAAASMKDFKGIHKNAPFIGFVFVAPYQNRFCCTRADLPGSLSGDAV